MKSMATTIQDRLIEASIDSVEQGRDVFLAAPTGTGKSRQFSLVAADQADKGRRVLVLAERKSLVLQAERNLGKWSTSPIETSIGMDGRIDQSGQVVYSTVQTAHELRDQLRKYDAVVVDEAHHATIGNVEYMETLAALEKTNPRMVLIAASATPPPLYGRLHPRLAAADKHIMTFQEGIDAKLIDLPETLTPPMLLLDNHNVRSIVDGHQKRRNSATLEGGIARDLGRARGDDWPEQLVSIYERLLADRRTLAFFDSIKEAGAFMREAEEAGHAPDIVHSRRGLAANEASLDAFHSGRSRLLVSVDMISEGIDLDADGILLDKKTTSADEYKQIIGRETRSHGVDRERKARLVDTGASTHMHGEIGAIAAMQTLRGGIERGTMAAGSLLPDAAEQGFRPWVEVKTPNVGRPVWGTNLDGAIVYAAREGDRYAMMRSSQDRNGARVDLVQLEGQRKGMPSGAALGEWLSEAMRRNEKSLTRLIGHAREGVNDLAKMISTDWARNGGSIERNIAMLTAGPVMAMGRQQAFSR